MGKLNTGTGRHRAAPHRGAAPVRPPRAPSERVAAVLPPSRPRHRRHGTRIAAATSAFGLVATLALAPLLPSLRLAPFARADAAGAAPQTLEVAGTALPGSSDAESYTVATGEKTLIAGGTNEDWAKLVLVDGGFPTSDANVTVLLRWMRQENGVDDWWNRNNPLNNGNGSGGGSGLGSYATLADGAYYVADSLRSFSFYDAIEAALDASADPATTAAAIWASPWAGSHYGYGSHWSTAPVRIVEAPGDAWGR